MTVIGSGQSNAQDQGWAALINKLNELGMWDDADPAELKSEFDAMIAKQNFWLVDSPRFLMADSEEFAEGGIGEWLDENSEALAKRGFTYESHEDHCDESGYGFVLDGDKQTVYTEKQLQSENIWEIATIFVQRMLNTQLRNKNLETRAYLFGGGNDGFVALITPSIANAIIQSGLLDQRDQPYRLDTPDEL